MSLTGATTGSAHHGTVRVTECRRLRTPFDLVVRILGEDAEAITSEIKNRRSSYELHGPDTDA